MVFAFNTLDLRCYNLKVLLNLEPNLDPLDNNIISVLVFVRFTFYEFIKMFNYFRQFSGEIICTQH